MNPPTSFKQLRSTHGHIIYYRSFIHNYVGSIILALDKLLKKAERFRWSNECEDDFNVLKEKLESTPVLLYPDWNKQSHVHTDALNVSLGVVLAQTRDKNIDYPIYFVNKKLSTIERNYTTTEHESLAMVYSLQKFWHYLLWGSVQILHWSPSLNYLVNKPVLEGKIFKWIILFQEFTFEVIVKIRRMNVGTNHLSQLE